MSAIDEMRRLLDERGVSCQAHYLHASWCVGPKLYDAVDNLDGTLTVSNLTPEQAIAATLGGGECEMKPIPFMGWKCSKCGKVSMVFGDVGKGRQMPNFCPNCSAKVRKAVKR